MRHDLFSLLGLLLFKDKDSIELIFGAFKHLAKYFDHSKHWINVC